MTKQDLMHDYSLTAKQAEAFLNNVRGVAFNQALVKMGMR